MNEDIQVLIGNEAQYQEWEKFVQQNSAATLYSDWRWSKVIEQSFSHKAIFLLAKKNEAVVGILPLIHLSSLIFGNALISLPFLNAGGLLVQSNEAKEALLQKAKSLADELEVKYLEIRSQEKLELENLVERAHKVRFVLSLEKDAEVLLKSFPTKLRSQINRPQKSGAEFYCKLRKEISLKDIENFYQVFSKHNRDLGTPVYTKKFFYELLNNFSDNLLLGFVKLNGKLTSVGIVLLWHDNAEIFWASSLRKYHKESVNMLLYWGIIKELCCQGIKHFDFGRTSLDSGGYAFKKQWGGKEIPLYWYYYSKGNFIPDVNPKASKFSLAVSIWQKLPLCIANVLGPKISRHIP